MLMLANLGGTGLHHSEYLFSFTHNRRLLRPYYVSRVGPGAPLGNQTGMVLACVALKPVGDF